MSYRHDLAALRPVEPSYERYKATSKDIEIANRILRMIVQEMERQAKTDSRFYTQCMKAFPSDNPSYDRGRELLRFKYVRA